MSGWQGSTRHDRLPPDWGEIRMRVLRRDGYRCRWTYPRNGRCSQQATDVDHIERGDDHSTANLRSLCREHHLRKSGHEGQQARQSRNTTRTRPVEPHPGRMTPP